MSQSLPTHAIEIGDARFNVYDEGQGQTLVFIHGNGSRLTHWEPQLGALSARFRCVAYDQRGYGASGPLTGKNSLASLADDAAAICAALGITHAFFVALSLGGAVAQAVALRHPLLVDGLILSGTTPIDPTQPVGEAPPITADVLRQIAWASLGPWKDAHSAEAEQFAEDIAATDPQTVRQFSPDFWSEMLPANISAPTLVIAGALDASSPTTWQQELARTIPNGEYLELPDVGHMTNLEAAATFTAAVERFVTAHTFTR